MDLRDDLDLAQYLHDQELSSSDRLDSTIGPVLPLLLALAAGLFFLAREGAGDAAFFFQLLFWLGWIGAVAGFGTAAFGFGGCWWRRLYKHPPKASVVRVRMTQFDKVPGMSEEEARSSWLLKWLLDGAEANRELNRLRAKLRHLGTMGALGAGLGIVLAGAARLLA